MVAFFHMKNDIKFSHMRIQGTTDAYSNILITEKSPEDQWQRVRNSVDNRPTHYPFVEAVTEQGAKGKKSWRNQIHKRFQEL